MPLTYAGKVNVTEPGKDPLRVNAVEASGNFFSVIGVQPMIGGGFPESDVGERAVLKRQPSRNVPARRRATRDQFGTPGCATLRQLSRHLYIYV